MSKCNCNNIEAIRSELLSEYDEKIEDVSNVEEAILLRQELMEEYDFASDNISNADNNYEDEGSENNDAPVKTLINGRNL